MTTFLEPNQTLVAGSKSLPGNYYTSTEIFQAELERIFFERWLVVGRLEQIPQAGDYFLVSIGPESIIVVRDRQGQVNAFYNVCRYRGTRICTQETGRFSASIQCPYQAWTYGLDGKLIGAPLMDEVFEFDKSDYPLHAVNLVEWQGFF